MEIIFSFLLFAGCLLPLRAQLQPEVNSADADYAAYEALASKPFTGEPQQMGWEKYLRGVDDNRQALSSAVLSFYANHPADSRRWELLVWRIYYPPYFIKGFGPEVATEGAAAIIPDVAAVEAWRRRYQALMQALLASSDAPPNLREKAEWYGFSQDLRAVAAAKARGEPYDYSGFPARFDAHVAQHPQMDSIIYRATEYCGIMESSIPGTSLEIWQHLLDAPNAALRDKAAERVRFLQLTSKPLELTFTAADGRVVDLKTLRGKVVLLDFWATWCEPCKDEIPNIVANYKKYRDQGFEVVGITMENAQLDPADTPEHTVIKLAKARKALMAFTAANDMPWPQYFDGKIKENGIAQKYSVQSIPAMFLLDQQGRLVSTDARGPELGVMVKKLLKL